MTYPAETTDSRVPFRSGFLAGDLTNLAGVRFAGSRCRECGVTLLGRRRRCENCSSRSIVDEVFGTRGVVHSFTVQRYPPPLPFTAPQPWVPRVIAWIDLEGHGPRILGPVSGLAERVEIAQAVLAEFHVAWRDDHGREVVAFVFRPVDAEGSR